MSSNKKPSITIIDQYCSGVVVGPELDEIYNNLLTYKFSSSKQKRMYEILGDNNIYPLVSGIQINLVKPEDNEND